MYDANKDCMNFAEVLITLHVQSFETLLTLMNVMESKV